MVEKSLKASGAFRTIGEVSAHFGVPRHVLRYWETRFTQLRPLQRAGNRRYYRPEDVALVERIHQLLNQQGYTVKGVQALLLGTGVTDTATAAAPPAMLSALISIRDQLAHALAQDDVAARL